MVGIAAFGLESKAFQTPSFLSTTVRPYLIPMELAPSSQIMPIYRMWMMIFAMFRSVWYFTSVDGTIKRKHKAKLDAECLGYCAGA